MTDSSKNKTRSKLTLKLPQSVKNETLSLKTAAPKIKKVNNSSIQVTIKGRKKDKTAESNEEQHLKNKELEARINAINSSVGKKPSAKTLKSHKILSEAVKKSQEEQISVVVEDSAKDVIQEVIVSETAAPIDYEVDNFDVRSKIKQSIEVSNREKAERDKVLEERKKEEKERQEQERKRKEAIEKEKEERKKTRKSLGSKDKIVDDGEKRKKLKNYEEKRINTKKLAYIVNNDDDSEGGGYRGKRRKKQTFLEVDSDQKEYKKLSREVALPELITVSDLADRMTEKVGDVVKKLFSMGMVVTSNQAIDADTAEIIIGEFGHAAKRVSHSDVENVLEEENIEYPEVPRAPVVTIMGHVDHGKTSLLDALRSTSVVDKEHGGITQHIGASRIETKSGKHITFLDTPGHEAFTEMRSRGANATDIVVLVVAADDGVKDQTIEAIHHAKAASVPIIVAVNKIDKPEANPKRVENELLSHEIVSENLGGDVIFVPVSAKAKTGLDDLEEAILLQADVLDLKSANEGKSSGIVLESRVDPSRGVVATLLVQKGTLDISDIIVAGTSYGKVRKMSDDTGKNVKIATPSVPVEVLGLDSAPNAGDKFVEVSEERQAREIISYRARKEKEEKALKNSAKSLMETFKESGEGKIKYLNVIIKADVHGSAEAINGSIIKLNNEEVSVKVIHMATGGISESDVSLAAASNAVIIGFNVRANAPAKDAAENKSVDIRYYSVIYNLVDDLKLMLSGMLDPSKSEEYLGNAEIRQVFKVSGAGKVAGCFITSGLVKRSARVRLLRDNVVIHDGILKILKRFKDDVKEVKSGFECGMSFENYEDIKEGDTIECYEVKEEKRSL